MSQNPLLHSRFSSQCLLLHDLSFLFVGRHESFLAVQIQPLLNLEAHWSCASLYSPSGRFFSLAFLRHVLRCPATLRQ